MEKQNKNKEVRKFGKKAQAFKLFLWIIFEFILVLVVSIFVVVIVNSYVDIDYNTEELERELFIQNLMNSPGGISYIDQVSGKVYPGIIDLDDFSNTAVIEARLQSTFSYGNKNPMIAVAMTLKNPHIPSYFLTKEGKLRPHILETGTWTEKELVDIYTEEQLTPFIHNNEQVQTVYYQRAWYEHWTVIEQTEYEGKGGFTEHTTSQFVLAQSPDGRKQKAVLEFSIITPGRS